MTRARFLNDLYCLLAGNGMNADQAEQHLTYYAEMLADRMEEGMSEDEAVSRMEDVDTIARRILEEEGLAYRPLGEIPMKPPACPDIPGSGGGGKRAYRAPKRWSGRKLAQAALWALAVIIALGAVTRWLFVRGGHNTRVDYAVSTPVEEVAAPEAPYAEWYDAWDLPYEYGYEYAGDMTSFSAGLAGQIDIQWAAGTVLVQSWSGDEIQLQEYARSELNERTAYSCEAGDGTLSIRYRASTGLGSVKDDKWLTVLVPDGMLEELEIQTTSANILLNGLEQQELDVHSASGDVILNGCYIKKTDLESITGELQLNGLYGEEAEFSTTSGYISGTAGCVDIDVETTSGDVSLYTDESTEKVKASTVSGDVWLSAESAALRSIGVSSTSGDVSLSIESTALQSLSVSSTSGDVSLSIPFDMGFTLDYATVSGELHNSSFNMMKRDGENVYNGGGCEIKVETVSGGLELY